MKIGGYFSFEKYKDDVLVDSWESKNMISNEFVELVQNKLFKSNVYSGITDTRTITHFFVGSSEEKNRPDMKYSEIEDRVLGNILPVDAYTFDTNYIASRRIMRISFTSPSGENTGMWYEVGLVISGSGQEPLLFNRTTDIEMSEKEAGETIKGYYNIVF